MSLAEAQAGATHPSIHRGWSALTESLTTPVGGQRASFQVKVPNVPAPAWWEGSHARIEELFALEANWDTYGAPAVDQGVVRSVVRFLWTDAGSAENAPWIVPTSLGGLQLEWHSDGLDVEIEFVPTGDITIYVEDRDGEDEGALTTRGDLWARVLGHL